MTDLALSCEPDAAGFAASDPLSGVLELRGITKRWQRRPEPVLDGLDLVLEEGTVTWVAGRNGTGKTTLLRIASGLIGADAGTIRLNGLHPVADRRAYANRVGHLGPGTSGLYARLSVVWHLRWWARIALLSRQDGARAVRESLQRFELEDLADRRVDRLSMGQRQRVRLAAAFLHDPQVVLLDEPATSLDDEGVAVLIAAVQRATAAGSAVLWCSPAGEEERLPSHRRLLLDQGRVAVA